MLFLSFLVILLFGAGLFWLVAYVLRHRMRKAALAIGILGTVIALFLLSLWIVEISGWERDGLYKQLLYGLQKEELRSYVVSQEDLFETSILMMSQASTALVKVAPLIEGQRSTIAKELSWMAAYVNNEEYFTVWKNRRNWEQELYFLTHAAIVIAHYQSFTGDEQYEERWTRIANFLVNGISRSQYKHLASRPGDAALRPTDNAAGLYALKLYDEVHASEHLAIAGEDWSDYIRKELQYEDTKLPCAGFTATNRCRLAPVGGSLAMLNSYTAAAELPISKDFWREFRYYYKESFANVFAWTNLTPSDAETPEFCDFSVAPVECGRFEEPFAQYAAAIRKDWITYYQLNNRLLMKDFFNPPNQLWNQPPQEQIKGMLYLSTRLAASCRP